MTKHSTRNFLLRQIVAADSRNLYELSKKAEFKKQSSAILGKGLKENQDLAHAYETNKKDFPIAKLIISKESGDIIGAVVAQSCQKSLTLSILVSNADQFAEVFVHFANEIKNMETYQKIYIMPTLRNINEMFYFLSGANISLEEENNPEFTITL